MNEHALWERSHSVWDLSHFRIKMAISNLLSQAENSAFAITKRKRISYKTANLKWSLVGPQQEIDEPIRPIQILSIFARKL